MVESSRFRKASESMGRQFFSTDLFVTDAIRFLSNKFKDLHLEYHSETGWQVTSCYLETSGMFSETSWITGDGSLSSALLEAVEKLSGVETGP